MTNLEQDPDIKVCDNQTHPSDRAEWQQGAPDAHPVEVLDARAVPLGGPRAMLVQRTLPQRARSLIGAWCFLDYFGPDDVAESGGMNVARHPHTGLATVSWLFEGAVAHIDSAGNWARVKPGDVDLMNAGRGITHSEISTTETTVLHGVQLWYAFPDEHRFSEPGLARHTPEPVTGDGFTARVFLGSLLGQTSPVATYIPLTGAELRLDPGAELVLEVPADHEHGLQAITGTVHLDDVTLDAPQLGYVGPGRTRIRIRAGDEPVLAIFIGGQPLGEQIIMWWNFIGRTSEEITEWRDRYQQEMGFDVTAASDLAQSGELQFGEFPPDQPAPLPAPALPGTRLRPRG